MLVIIVFLDTVTLTDFALTETRIIELFSFAVGKNRQLPAAFLANVNFQEALANVS